MRGWVKAAAKWVLFFMLVVGLMPIGANAKTNSIVIIENDGCLYDEANTAKSYEFLALEDLNRLMTNPDLESLSADDIAALIRRTPDPGCPQPVEAARLFWSRGPDERRRPADPPAPQ